MKTQLLFEKIIAECTGEDGQGLAEYALIIFLFTIAMAASFTSFTSALGTLYNTIQTAFP